MCDGMYCPVLRPTRYCAQVDDGAGSVPAIAAEADDAEASSVTLGLSDVTPTDTAGSGSDTGHAANPVTNAQRRGPPRRAVGGSSGAKRHIAELENKVWDGVCMHTQIFVHNTVNFVRIANFGCKSSTDTDQRQRFVCVRGGEVAFSGSSSSSSSFNMPPGAAAKCTYQLLEQQHSTMMLLLAGAGAAAGAQGSGGTSHT
jgi:hypothetical protein